MLNIQSERCRSPAVALCEERDITGGSLSERVTEFMHCHECISDVIGLCDFTLIP